MSGKDTARSSATARGAASDPSSVTVASSTLGDIQPDHRLAGYTTKLINVLAQLVELEQAQSELLERVCSGHTTTAEELHAGGALAASTTPPPETKTRIYSDQPSMLD